MVGFLFYKDITRLVNTALRMRELDVDCRSGGKPKPLKTNATGGCLVYYIENTKQLIHMATGQYPNQTSGAFIVNHLASQVTMVWPCLRYNTLTKIILQGKVDQQTVDDRRTPPGIEPVLSDCESLVLITTLGSTLAVIGTCPPPLGVGGGRR